MVCIIQTECHQGCSSLLDVLVGMFLVIVYPMVRRCHQVISIQEIIVGGNNHMRETAAATQEERADIHLDTIRIVATHIHRILLLRHRVLDDMGNPPRMLGCMVVGPTSLHHMQEPNSGSSNNLLVPILKVGYLLLDLIPDRSSHRTATATWIGLQTGGHQVRVATRPASSLVLALALLLLLARTYFDLSQA